MKTFIKSVLSVSAIALMSSVSHADYFPRRERPVLSGPVYIVQSAGIYANTKRVSVTLTQQDDARRFTGAILTIDGRSEKLVVKSIRPAGCGSRQIQAVSKSGVGTELILTDHSTRLCLDYRPYSMDVTIRPYGIRTFGLIQGGIHRLEPVVSTMDVQQVQTNEPNIEVLPFDQN